MKLAERRIWLAFFKDVAMMWVGITIAVTAFNVYMYGYGGIFPKKPLAIVVYENWESLIPILVGVKSLLFTYEKFRKGGR